MSIVIIQQLVNDHELRRELNLRCIIIIDYNFLVDCCFLAKLEGHGLHSYNYCSPLNLMQSVGIYIPGGGITDNVTYCCYIQRFWSYHLPGKIIIIMLIEVIIPDRYQYYKNLIFGKQ